MDGILIIGTGLSFGASILATTYRQFQLGFALFVMGFGFYTLAVAEEKL